MEFYAKFCIDIADKMIYCGPAPKPIDCALTRTVFDQALVKKKFKETYMLTNLINTLKQTARIFTQKDFTKNPNAPVSQKRKKRPCGSASLTVNRLSHIPTV
jgi:hypothetical protein